MLVRNPKKRPSASKMLSVSAAAVKFAKPPCDTGTRLTLSSSLQHLYLTQQGLSQELTLDLLEKYRHPEKMKTCLVAEDEDMEV